MTDTLHSFLTQHRIHEVECVIPDMTGIARGKILPRDLFMAAPSTKLLPNTVRSPPTSTHMELGSTIPATVRPRPPR